MKSAAGSSCGIAALRRREGEEAIIATPEAPKEVFAPDTEMLKSS